MFGSDVIGILPLRGRVAMMFHRETENKTSGCWLYIVFAGEPRSVGELRTRIKEAVGVREETSGLRISLGDERPLLNAIEDNDVSMCARLWFRVRDASIGLKNVTAQIERVLGWRAKAYWGVADDETVLPPFPGSLMRLRQSAETIGVFRKSMFSFLLFEAVIIAVIFFTQRAGSQGMSISIGASLVICILGLLRYLDARNRVMKLSCESTDARTNGTPMAPESSAEVSLAVSGILGHFRIQAVLLMIELVVLVVCFETRNSELQKPWIGDSFVWWFVIFLLFSGVFKLLLGTSSRDVTARKASRITSAANWLGAALSKKEFLPRAVDHRCIKCGHRLDDPETCRCPVCGTDNYYLLARPDAQALARRHGAVF